MNNPLLFRQENRIAILTLNRPDRHNAFNDLMIDQFIQILTQLENTPAINLLILMANGKNFSAGADIEWMKKVKDFTEAENLADAKRLAKLLQMLSRFSKPTIALANGKTLGGGVGLLACCDIVLAEENAHFCFSETKIGLIPATIAPYIIQAIGARHAKYYFLTAEFFNAQRAKNIGLVQTIVEQGSLFTAGMKTALSLLKNGPSALVETKKLIACIHSFNEELTGSLSQWLAKIRVSEEAQEGLSAFLEKRSPTWNR